MRRRASRRSVSSCDSPGPRVPTPPPRRSRCCHMPRMRGRLYSSCASSTWSLPSALTACWAKMSRISCVRSTTRVVERVLEVALLRRVELVVDEQALGLGRRERAPSAPRSSPCRRRCAAPAAAGAGRRGRPARRPRCAPAPRSRPAPSSGSAPWASTARTKPRSGSGSGVRVNVESSDAIMPSAAPDPDLADAHARARRHRRRRRARRRRSTAT